MRFWKTIFITILIILSSGISLPVLGNDKISP